ncbi:MAG: lytic murein transglycosylase [Sphingomonas sp.]|nr:lytic murein transglycosylase [Sphingomonas sp.]
MTGAGRVALRFKAGLMVAGVVALALGPAEAQDSRLSPKAEARVQVAQAQPVTVRRPTYSQPTYPRPAYSQVPMARPATGFEQYKAFLIGRARSERVREPTIQAVIPGLRINSRAIALDRAQRPTAPSTSSAPPSFGPYLSRHITSSLINRGKSRYYSHWPSLSRIQARTGVDPSVVMAIYGKETSYGSVTGNFDLLEALASLAYEGRRRAMFEAEFIAALKLLDQGVQRWQLKGSYAGATGFPQFMPTVVLRLRADGDGDGYADIWRSEPDAFASIANYLQQAGWKRGIPWAVPARIPPTLNRAAIRSGINPPRCAAVFRRHSRWLTVAEWRALGVVSTGRSLPDNEMAALMETEGSYAPGYLITTNYRAILDYNCSNFYAMSIGLLADAIARG